MDQRILNMLEQMAEHGTAPEDGCSLFGVGYEDAISRIHEVYFNKRFQRRGSAEKFVIGPFGSGKTHFLNQLIERAQSCGCVTVKVNLNKNIDYTQRLTVYKEVAAEIRVPPLGQRGISRLLAASLEKIQERFGSSGNAEECLQQWVSRMDEADFESVLYGRMIKKGLLAYLEKSEDTFEKVCRWLSGEVDNRQLCRELGVSPVSKSEMNLFAKRALFSLVQFVSYVGYRGTLLCLDEAEQGLSVEKKRMENILSALMADINAVAALRGGSLLIVYAVTPDIADKLETFPALQQRLADPGPNQGFFDGNTLAPKIDLRRRPMTPNELYLIGRNLVRLFYQATGGEVSVPESEILEHVRRLAAQIYETNISSSNRRDMVKQTCTMLLRLLDTGVLETASGFDHSIDEDEV